MAQNENAKVEIRLDGKLAEQSLKDLQAEARRLFGEMRKLQKGTKEYESAKSSFQKVNTQIRKTNDEIKGVNKAFSGLKKEIRSFGTIALAYLGIDAITGQIGNLIRRNAELSDSLADVQKNTELTSDELEQLMKNFKTFNTRTSRKELLQLAVAAGKSGVRGITDLTNAVRELDIVQTGLGEDLGDDAVRQIIKMSKNFNVGITEMGSAINKLSDSTIANAGYLTNWMARMTGTSKTMNILAGDTLGYGTVLDEVGLQVEMSSTAMNGFFIDFTKNTEKFGQAAGFAKGELKALVGEKGTNEGFLAFLEGMNRTTNGAEDFLVKLEELGINGERGSQVFLALSQNVDKVRERQVLANKEIATGSSILDEYARKNENLAAKAERVQKALFAAFSNSKIKETIEDIIGAIERWVRVPLSETLAEDRMQVQRLTIELQQGNITAERRAEIIGIITEKYPKYLEGLDMEKVSNEDLITALEGVNEELRKKIILQAQAERIEEVMRKSTEAAKDLGEAEDELYRNMTTFREKYNVQLKNGLTLEGQVLDLIQKMKASSGGGKFEDSWITGETNRLERLLQAYKEGVGDVAAFESEIQKLNEQSKRMMKEFFGSDNPNEIVTVQPAKTNLMAEWGVPNNLNNDEENSVVPEPENEEKKAQEVIDIAKQLYFDIDEMRKAFEAERDEADLTEIEKITAKWQKLEDLTREFYATGQIDAYEQARALEEIDQARRTETELAEAEAQDEWLAQKAAFAEELRLMGLSEMEYELAMADAKYDALIEKAIEFGLDSAKIEELRQSEIAAIKKKWAVQSIKHEQDYTTAILSIHSHLADGIANLLTIAGANQEQAAKYEAIITLITVSLEMAQALAQLVSKQAETSITPIDFAIKAAAAFATVTRTFAKIKAVADERSVPPAPKYKRGGRFQGPSHSQGGMPILDPATGRIVGEMEGGEPILSNDTYRNNQSIVDALLYNSMYRNGAALIPQFEFGGVFDKPQQSPPIIENRVNNNVSVNNGEMMKVAVMLLEATAKLESRLGQPIEARFDWDYFERESKRVKDIESDSLIG